MPPIAGADRRKRTTLLPAGGLRAPGPPPGKPGPGFESPTVVDRALGKLAQITDAARADQLAKDLEAAARSDPAIAANLAYELGELCERRLGNDDRAVAAYRRAVELDASLAPARWALRRVLAGRAGWPEIAALIDVELGRAPGDAERVELLVERAVVLGHQGASDGRAHLALDAAVKLAPRHHTACLELERVAARSGDPAAVLEVWDRLADAVDQPEHRIAYQLALARAAAARDRGRAHAALDAAAKLAAELRSGPLAERIARERLRIAEDHGTPGDAAAATEGLVSVLTQHPQRASAHRGELVALHRRQAQLVRAEAPARAWGYLQQALAAGPDEPLVLADLIELAGELGRYGDLPALVATWQAVETDAGRQAMLSRWCADAHLAPEHREPRRALLRALESTMPGFVLLASSAECDALADASRVRARLDLAHTYLAAARAAMLGTWLGPRSPPRPDPGAAAALYIQAAHLLVYYVATQAALDLARDALGNALEAAPDHPAVLEAWIDIDDTTGRADAALARLRARAGRAPDRRAALERAIRVAHSHGMPDAVLALERELVGLAPGDFPLAWRFEATLSRLGRHDERAELLARLAQDDPDPARRRIALTRAARLHERTGAVDAAIECYRQLLTLDLDDPTARDALLGLLRSEQRWAELVSARRGEARAVSDRAALRPALREAAWVLEVCLDDAAQASAVYDQWLAQLPEDRAALDGAARCRAALGDHGGEVAARAAISALDATAEARWLYAGSLERAARHDQAAEQYRGLCAGDEPSIAATGAALALGDLAARSGDVALATEAGDALARRTSDPRLGAALLEHGGWMCLVALEDAARASQAFSAALALEPARRGALLGAALVAARQLDPARQGQAYGELAIGLAMPEAAAALLLRAAAIAAANGEPELAGQRVEAARSAAPESVHALFVAAEVDPPRAIDPADPFAAIDQLLERADLLDRRGALTDDPDMRTAWDLERAEILELAGQPRETCGILAGVLERRPDDWRAISALRRIALRAGDRRTWAHASYALARLRRDPRARLQLLRDALEVFDRPGPANHPGYALACCRRIAPIGPRPAELERLRELWRKRGDAPPWLDALVEPTITSTATPVMGMPAAIPVTGDDPTEPVHKIEARGTGERSIDPFGNTTAVTDLSELQEQERELARSARGSAPTIETTADTDVSALAATDDSGRDDLGPVIPPPVRLPEPRVRELLDLAAIEPSLDARAIELPEDPQLSPDDSAVVMLSYEQLQPVRSDEDAADLVRQYEREIAAVDDPAGAVTLHIEAGRLCETLGEPERARSHYDAALLADRRATAALRGLRRIARAAGDLEELTRLVDAELAVAGPRERDAVLRYRVDLLMATGEHDVARVAVGELLDRSPSDIAALLAHLELALLDGRADELGKAIELLADALTDPALREAIQSIGAVVAVHRGDAAAAVTRFTRAAASAGPGASAMRLAAARHAAAPDRGAAIGAALLDLACHVEAEDPVTAAALAVRAQLVGASPETMATAAQLAVQATPREPLVARIAADTARVTGDRTTTSHAFARWARCASAPAERAYAAARAAELEPARLGRLWAQVLEHEPADDYAAARLRAAHVASGDTRAAIELDRQLARDTRRGAPLLRAVAELLDDDQGDAAIEALVRGRDQHPASIAITDALADAFAEAGRWIDRAKLLGELAGEPRVPARDIARLRAALAWDRAARAGASDGDERRRTTIAALDAWDLVLEDDPRAAVAHAARLVLASQLGDPDVLIDAMARAQAAEPSPWAASSLALRRARLLSSGDARLAEEVARDAAPGLDDPRRTLVVMMAAAHRRDLGEAATALEDRAARLASPRPAGADPSLEAAVLRLRAAQLALDADDAARAAALLAQVDPVLPGLAGDLIDAARRRAGEPAPADPPAVADSFVRAMRDAELTADRGQAIAALELYRRALEIRPAEPLAAEPLVRIAAALREPAPIAALALEQLRTAEAMADSAARATAFELMARADELRGDAAAVTFALEAAAQADPGRLDLLHRLERELAADRRHGELLRLRERQLDQLRRSLGDAGHPIAGVRDVVALAMDAATLAVRARSADAVLARLYRGALEADPHHRPAQLALEALLRRAGASADLAALEDHIATSCDDPRSRAAFLTRAGETLVAIGEPGEAVQRFARAVQAVPTHRPALHAWRHTALAHQLWRELADAVTCKASLGGEPRAVAALHHFAGVALMDKAREAEPAIAALRRALELEPGHLDSFLRLRCLLETADHRDELAALLHKRLDNERDPSAQIELHRTLAEHCYGTGDRESAMQHYRAVTRIDPTDVRAHAAIADLASEHGHWQDAVAAVMARIPLEPDARVLRSLHYRIGALYADHDDARSALAAFQRALGYRPDDRDALSRIADLGAATAEWQIALDACDHLIKLERDPDKLAAHFQRAATIFDRGLGDRQRAERMLQLATDSAPTSPECLRLLVKFYQDADDPVGLRAQLNRIAGAMQARVAQDPGDGAAYRILARAIAARSDGAGAGSQRIARAAAELAQLLGAGGEPEQRLIAGAPHGDGARALGRSDELVFSHAAQPEVRQILRLLAQPIAKHVGVDLGARGVGRKDRLPSGDPVTAIARDVAVSLGFKDVEVYVSARDPYLAIAEPTSPVSLILGRAIAAGDAAGVRFAAAGVLKLAHSSLAIPARLSPDELGVLGFAVLRLFRPELIGTGVDLDEVNAQMSRLRRAIPTALFNEVAPHARAVERFSPEGLARDLKLARLRAGLVATDSVLPGLALLAGPAGADLRSVVTDPLARELIGFALSEARVSAP